MNTTYQFIEKAIKIHKNEYDYSHVNYMGSKIKVDIICKNHGSFLQTPNDHLQKKGCPKCKYIKSSATKTFTQLDFLNKTREIHGNKYDYSNVIYERNDKYIEIICPLHGNFKQRAANHMVGHGCKKCKNDKMAEFQSYGQEIFIKKAKEIHGNKYDYSNTKYIGCNIEVKIVCLKHGIFSQLPYIHLQKHGCPKCNSSHGEMKIQQWLDKNKIDYIYQKSFKDCRGIGKGMLRFDFYIPSKNILIEFDGKQHFNSKIWISKCHIITDNQLLLTQQNDNIKNEYSKSKNICLLRISYTEINKIDEILKKHLTWEKTPIYY